MGTKFKKIRQDPIDRQGRPSEFRPAWIGGMLVAIAVFLIVTGAFTKRRVGNGNGGNFSEYDLVNAATRGGIVVAEDTPSDEAGGATTKPADTKPKLEIKKTKGKDYCPT